MKKSMRWILRLFLWHAVYIDIMPLSSMHAWWAFQFVKLSRSCGCWVPETWSTLKVARGLQILRLKYRHDIYHIYNIWRMLYISHVWCDTWYIYTPISMIYITYTICDVWYISHIYYIYNMWCMIYITYNNIHIYYIYKCDACHIMWHMIYSA